ncbi:MAG TPA: hypothetical protein PKJ43_02595 [Prolixibacteraceae bacterium]|nr:hypothetical protein [Prolixibacteraceae bacterium]
MKRKVYIALAIAMCIVAVFFLLPAKEPGRSTPAKQEAPIFPDYSSVTLPYNIAPINFMVEDGAEKVIATFSSKSGKKIVVKSSNNKIEIPIQAWKKLLSANKGNDLIITIYSKKKGSAWVKYPSITNYISSDEIDSHIVFRHISAGYILWEKMGIYQQNIETSEKKPILLNDRTNRNCMNCHTFGNYDPQKMLIHLRSKPGGTILYNNSEAKLLNTKTPFTMSSCVYPAWHPNGKAIAFSVNIIEQKFHSAGNEAINVYDKSSDLVVYDVEKNMITTTPAISTSSMENLPSWSPDGKYLYYISAPAQRGQNDSLKTRYDLLRIPYSYEQNTWGLADTLLRSSDTGLSITFPEVSPDGRFIVFCMADQGYFSVHYTSSDLYIMDIATREYSKLPINSDHVESFHYWSSNSKWLMFISKRLDNLYSRVYFTHIDEKGNASKPFLMPQTDPETNRTLNLNYNRPVFVNGEVTISPASLAEVANESPVDVKFDPSVNIDALSGATRYAGKTVH